MSAKERSETDSEGRAIFSPDSSPLRFICRNFDTRTNKGLVNGAMKRFLSFNAQPIIRIAVRTQRDPSASNYLRLRFCLKNLPREHLSEMIALMWLGRGFDRETVADWTALLEHAALLDPDYLWEKAQLGTYLMDGEMKIIESVLQRQT